MRALEEVRKRHRDAWVIQRQMWWDLGPTGVPKEKTDRKKAICVLRGFWKTPRIDQYR